MRVLGKSRSGPFSGSFFIVIDNGLNVTHISLRVFTCLVAILLEYSNSVGLCLRTFGGELRMKFRFVCLSLLIAALVVLPIIASHSGGGGGVCLQGAPWCPM